VNKGLIREIPCSIQDKWPNEWYSVNSDYLYVAIMHEIPEGLGGKLETAWFGYPTQLPRPHGCITSLSLWFLFWLINNSPRLPQCSIRDLLPNVPHPVTINQRTFKFTWWVYKVRSTFNHVFTPFLSPHHHLPFPPSLLYPFLHMSISSSSHERVERQWIVCDRSVVKLAHTGHLACRRPHPCASLWAYALCGDYYS